MAAQLTDEHKARVMALATDFPKLWSDPATPQRERKRMARLLIEDVTLVKTSEIHLHVRFRGGRTMTLTVPVPLTGWAARQTNPDTLALLDRLLDDHTDADAASILNDAGLTSGTGQRFSARIVLHLRRGNALPSHHERLLARGMLTVSEMAHQLGVDPSTIKAWWHAGILVGHKANDKNEPVFEPPVPGDPRLVKKQGSSLKKRVLARPSIGGAI